MIRTIRLNRAVWVADLEQHLGEPGGFASVYAANGADGEQVAIKILRTDLGDSVHRELEFVEKFVGHVSKHIIPILDCGIDTETNEACIVMARADRSLRDRIHDA